MLWLERMPGNYAGLQMARMKPNHIAYISYLGNELIQNESFYLNWVKKFVADDFWEVDGGCAVG
jgi:hypothetical protein